MPAQYQEMLDHFWNMVQEGAADEQLPDGGGYLFVIRSTDEERWGDLVAEGRRLLVYESNGVVFGHWC
jgi:hypothetical protein